MAKTKASLQPIFPHPAWIEIDLQQFKSNLVAIRKKIGSRLLCLPVKANAYGHGLCEISHMAQDAGVDYLGVSCLKEGAELRLAGITIPIFVFGAIHEDQISDLIERDLEFSLSSRYKADLVAQVSSRLNKRCRVHIEIDTGMQRTGMRPETAIKLLEWLQNINSIEVVGVYSHLATADTSNHPFAFQQIEIMQHLCNQLREKKWIWHLANSGGVAFYPESYFDMVRPGLLCYGYFPNGEIDPNGQIAPCFSLKSKISYFKVVAPGEGISYSHLYRTTKQTRVVTVPVGYGDGYRRSLSNQGEVLIRGKKYRISGAICMDQFMIDIGNDEMFVGDEVTLIGKQGNEEIRLERLAHMAQTIPYEILCTFNNRIPRVYSGMGKNLR